MFSSTSNISFVGTIVTLVFIILNEFLISGTVGFTLPCTSVLLPVQHSGITKIYSPPKFIGRSLSIKTTTSMDESEAFDLIYNNREVESMKNSTKNEIDNHVTFNVSGTIYNVSTSLLGQYPNTMLARMVWLGNDSEKTSSDPLFVDRDGKRFQFILEYMRDGPGVTLPVNVSKKSVLNDLEYFGFEDVNPKDVSVHATYSVYMNMLDEMNRLDSEVETRVTSDLSTRLSAYKKDKQFSWLARYCFLRFKFSGNLIIDLESHQEGEFYRDEHNRYNKEGAIAKLKEFTSSLVHSDELGQKALSFNKYLNNYGLKYNQIDTTKNYVKYDTSGRYYSDKRVRECKIYLEIAN